MFNKSVLFLHKERKTKENFTLTVACILGASTIVHAGVGTGLFSLVRSRAQNLGGYWIRLARKVGGFLFAVSCFGWIRTAIRILRTWTQPPLFVSSPGGNILSKKKHLCAVQHWHLMMANLAYLCLPVRLSRWVTSLNLICVMFRRSHHGSIQFRVNFNIGMRLNLQSLVGSSEWFNFGLLGWTYQWEC